MPEILRQCPLCKEPDFLPFFTFPHKDRPTVEWHLCTICGGVFASPRPTDLELRGYYNSDYRQQVEGTSKPVERNLREESERAVRQHWFLRRFIPKVERHLDIGSSAGLLLAEIQSDYKCESFGIEPGDEFREFADDQIKRAGGNMRSFKTLNEAPDWTYDLITISHVLEHINDPIGYLENLVNHYLPEGGHLMIEVPNLFGEPTALIFPHVIAFCQETLWQSINKASLIPIEIETSTHRRFPIAPPSYLTAIAKKGGLDIATDYIARHRAMLQEHATLAHIQQEQLKAQANAIIQPSPT